MTGAHKRKSSKKILFRVKGVYSYFRVEFPQYLSIIFAKAQRGYQNFLGFFAFSGFLFQTLPVHILSFVLMTERGKERLQSPPFDKRKEVKM